jgi:hypothetical protein
MPLAPGYSPYKAADGKASVGQVDAKNADDKSDFTLA